MFYIYSSSTLPFYRDKTNPAAAAATKIVSVLIIIVRNRTSMQYLVFKKKKKNQLRIVSTSRQQQPTASRTHVLYMIKKRTTRLRKWSSQCTPCTTFISFCTPTFTIATALGRGIYSPFESGVPWCDNIYRNFMI